MTTSSSMTGRLRRVIVKRPLQAFRSAASIEEQWRDLGYLEAPRLDEAEVEHRRLVEILEGEGVEVLFLPEDPDTGLDSLYTHDPALVTDEGVVLLQTGKPQRRGEAEALGRCLGAWDVPVLGRIEGDATAEGGDALWLDVETLVLGRSYRTNEEGIRAIRSLLEPRSIRVISVDLCHWHGRGEVLHLLSAISPLAPDLAVIYPPLVPVPLMELLEERGIATVEVPEAEFVTQGSNVLALAPRKVILLEGNPETERRLRDAGCEVTLLQGQEISFKGCGGPTCLTRPLFRDPA